MSARIVIDLDGGAVEVTVRSIGACTCGTESGAHDAACGVLQPARVDLVLADPMYVHRHGPWWWRRKRH